MDPLMLIPQPKAPASGFWQITSLLHIPIGQGVVLNGEVAQSDNLAKTMAAVVRKAKGSVKEVALSVDAHLVFQIPLGPVTHYFGARWELNFISLPKNPNTLDFQDIEVRRVLQLLADLRDINLVVSENVTGNLSLRLKDISISL